jgi:hypothetical protein
MENGFYRCERSIRQDVRGFQSQLCTGVECGVSIRNHRRRWGKLERYHEGTHDSATVTLTMSGETWLGMVNKQVNGMQAFMSGKLKASGDIMLAQRIEQLFPL